MKDFYDMNAVDQGYRDFVADAMSRSKENSEPRVFGNRGVGHAEAVISEIVGVATKNLDLLSGNLSDEVFDANELIERLDSQGDLIVRVLLDDDGSFGKSVIGDLEKYVINGRISVKYLSKNNAPEVHVATADGLYTRLETDKNTRSATVAFVNREFAKSAGDMFERFWAIAESEKPESK